MKAKKAAVLILALVTVFTLFGLTASAEELTSGDYSYVLLEDGTVKITAYNGTEKEVTVPDTIDEKAVTVIGRYAFNGEAELESLVIPGSVKEIEDNGIYGCEGLTTVTVQEGALEALGNTSIENCTALKNLNLPSNVKTIGTLIGCKALNNIVIASDNAYLKNVDGVIYSTDMKTLIKYPQGKASAEFYIPTSVTRIADFAFYEAANPVKVYIPLSVKEIEELAFGYSKVSLFYEGSSLPAEWKAAVAGFSFTPNGYKLRATDKITSTPGGNAINLKWNSVYGANCYRIYYKSGKNWKTLADVKSTSYTVNGTKYGTTYTFAVKAGKTSGGKTTWTSVYSTHTVKAKIPATAKVTSTQTASTIKLSWNAVKGVDGYKLYYKTASGWKALGNVTGTTATYKNLKAGSVYTFAVKAGKVVSGKVMWSDVYTTHKTATKPAKPAKVTATQTTSSITLNWNAVRGATGYRIYYKKGNGWAVAQSSVTGTTHTFKNLKAGARYTFAVRSYILGDGGVIWGDYTTYTAATKPNIPALTVTNPGVGQLAVKWNAVAGANEYRLYYKKNNSASYKLYKTYTSPQNLTFKNLASGDTYTFAVRAGVKTTGGVVLSDYTPKTIMVPYRTPQYLNIFKSGVFSVAYTLNEHGVDILTQVMYFDGKNLAYDSVDEKGNLITLLYKDVDKRWYYINHTVQVKAVLSAESAKDLSTPKEITAFLNNIYVPEKFSTSTFSDGYYIESYCTNSSNVTFSHYGDKLAWIQMTARDDPLPMIYTFHIYDIIDEVPKGTFNIPNYDDMGEI